MTEQQMIEQIAVLLSKLSLGLEQHQELQRWCEAIKTKLKEAK